VTASAHAGFAKQSAHLSPSIAKQSKPACARMNNKHLGIRDPARAPLGMPVPLGIDLLNKEVAPKEPMAIHAARGL
jgi:hypothetical protein